MPSDPGQLRYNRRFPGNDGLETTREVVRVSAHADTTDRRSERFVAIRRYRRANVATNGALSTYPAHGAAPRRCPRRRPGALRHRSAGDPLLPQQAGRSRGRGVAPGRGETRRTPGFGVRARGLHPADPDHHRARRLEPGAVRSGRRDHPSVARAAPLARSNRGRRRARRGDGAPRRRERFAASSSRRSPRATTRPGARSTRRWPNT